MYLFPSRHKRANTRAINFRTWQTSFSGSFQRRALAAKVGDAIKALLDIGEKFTRVTFLLTCELARAFKRGGFIIEINFSFELLLSSIR